MFTNLPIAIARKLTNRSESPIFPYAWSSENVPNPRYRNTIISDAYEMLSYVYFSAYVCLLCKSSTLIEAPVKLGTA